jgi:hypothetical protein
VAAAAAVHRAEVAHQADRRDRLGNARPERPRSLSQGTGMPNRHGFNPSHRRAPSSPNPSHRIASLIRQPMPSQKLSTTRGFPRWAHRRLLACGELTRARVSSVGPLCSARFGECGVSPITAG